MAEDFRFRDIALPAYGPTLVNSLGHGAMMPVLALRARELGASVAVAALVVGLVSVGMLIGSLPAGAVIARIGERRALVVAGVLDALAMAAAAVTPTVAWLALAVVASGMMWTVFLIARQGFMIDAVPFHLRARALSLLGGSHRVGLFGGPLIGAAVIAADGIRAVFLLAAAFSLLAALLALTMPDLGAERRIAAKHEGYASVASVLRRHRREMLTIGVAVAVIGSSRSIRTSLMPLWAEHVGISASTTSLIFAMASGVELLLVYPGGWVMDRFGRSVTAVPVVASAALACLLLPFAGTVAAVTAVMVLLAVGNGLGSGVVMTMGADTAPVESRAQFLGGMRLFGDIGMTSAPLLLSLLTAALPIAAASLVLGALGVAGAGWVGYWTRHLDRRLGLGVRRVTVRRD
ncbi:MFS transporter [Nostocoides sp. F2B08]|uniref:MFS transporter n=1 Tax=Nostocoides sp. F2B08 TaxID=2653936 RepID=UPI00126353BA|nr:MFS transporter [Tetrasphaera sp. F2B08]KAB7743868.1 MFS transporter [Tetrasphaera sp. F2B08]